MAALTTSSTSVSRSFVKGLGIASNSITVSPFIWTTNEPFLGFSGLIVTENPASFSTFSTFVALVRNTPQLPHLSIVASMLSPLASFFFAGETFALGTEASLFLPAAFFVVPALPIVLKSRLM